MRVFNEEKHPATDVVLVLSKKEVQALQQMMQVACDANKRKKTWKKMYNDLFEGAGYY